MTESYGDMSKGGDARAVAETDFSELGTEDVKYVLQTFLAHYVANPNKV